MPTSLALVGDFKPEAIAHQAIPVALALAGQAEQREVTWTWVASTKIRDPAADLGPFSGVWVVPASPYANMPGVLAAIRWARETRRPIFGSCGGFQHMLIEFARDVAGLAAADTAESNPAGTAPVVAPLACSLVEQIGPVRFTPNSRLRQIYGRDTSAEGYHCRYGLNEAYRGRLEAAGLRFTAFDQHGEVRAAELPEAIHPFFLGTLFQPERAALRSEVPPLARAFVRAAAQFTP